eukprot:SAG31_NODE_568_length_14006_cov_4.252119_1_plen_441_part_10
MSAQPCSVAKELDRSPESTAAAKMLPGGSPLALAKAFYGRETWSKLSNAFRREAVRRVEHGDDPPSLSTSVAESPTQMRQRNFSADRQRQQACSSSPSSDDADKLGESARRPSQRDWRPSHLDLSSMRSGAEVADEIARLDILKSPSIADERLVHIPWMQAIGDDEQQREPVLGFTVAIDWAGRVVIATLADQLAATVNIARGDEVLEIGGHRIDLHVDGNAAVAQTIRQAITKARQSSRPLELLLRPPSSDGFYGDTPRAGSAHKRRGENEEKVWTDAPPRSIGRKSPRRSFRSTSLSNVGKPTSARRSPRRGRESRATSAQPNSPRPSRSSSPVAFGGRVPPHPDQLRLHHGDRSRSPRKSKRRWVWEGGAYRQVVAEMNHRARSAQRRSTSPSPKAHLAALDASRDPNYVFDKRRAVHRSQTPPPKQQQTGRKLPKRS